MFVVVLTLVDGLLRPLYVLAQTTLCSRDCSACDEGGGMCHEVNEMRRWRRVSQLMRA